MPSLRLCRQFLEEKEGEGSHVKKLLSEVAGRGKIAHASSGLAVASSGVPRHVSSQYEHAAQHSGECRWARAFYHPTFHVQMRPIAKYSRFCRCSRKLSAQAIGILPRVSIAQGCLHLYMYVTSLKTR